MRISLSDSLSHAVQAGRGHLASLETLLRGLVTGEVPIGNTLVANAGSGITTGTGTIFKSSVIKVGDIIRTTILVDLTGLNSSAAGDIIGVDSAANCHLGQYNVDRNGTLFAGRVTCLEAPATGIDDIDLYSAVESTGTEDAAISALDETELLAAAAAWSAGDVKVLTALPAADEYLYLVGSGAGADATYTAGQFLIELEGY